MTNNFQDMLQDLMNTGWNPQTDNVLNTMLTPEGEYEATLAKVEYMTSNQKGTPGIVLHFDAVNLQTEEQVKIRDTKWFSEKPTAKNFNTQNLQTILKIGALGGLTMEDMAFQELDELPEKLAGAGGVQLQIDVKVKKGNDGNENNEFRYNFPQ